MLPACQPSTGLAVQVYERAVANLPPGNEKRYWQRYIYLWVKYALWEELDAGEADRAREVGGRGCAGTWWCLSS